MRIWSLSSGSSGNCYLVREGDTFLLMEAGISMARIEKGLLEIGVSLSQLSAVVVSHEHTDHWMSAPALSRRLKIPLVCSSGTLAAGPGGTTCYGHVAISAGLSYSQGPVRIDALGLPHDAREPLGFCIETASAAACIATDMGFATEEVVERGRLADLVILEANHDVDMLKRGSYPEFLKARILGDRGHLSNEAAASALLRMVEGRPRDVWLAHLSHANNSPRKAVNSVRMALRREGVAGIRVGVALRDRRSLHWDSEFATLEQLPLF